MPQKESTVSEKVLREVQALIKGLDELTGGCLSPFLFILSILLFLKLFTVILNWI